MNPKVEALNHLSITCFAENPLTKLLQNCFTSFLLALDHPVLLANTHFFFHPGADHIRNMQTYAIINELDSVAKSDACQGALRTSKPATLLCGDLNCSRGGRSDPLLDSVEGTSLWRSRCWNVLDNVQVNRHLPAHFYAYSPRSAI